MTIFHFEPGPHKLLDAFLDPRQNWSPGEIQTLTGYDQTEFNELRSRVSTQVHSLSSEDGPMLRQAANTLLGLPTTSHEACKEFLGSSWVESLRRYLGHEPLK